MKFAYIRRGGFDIDTSIYGTSNINRQQSSPPNPGQEI